MKTSIDHIRDRLLPACRAGLDFIYPPVCALCESLVECGDASRGPAERLCPECAARVAPHIASRCRRCSAPVGPYLDTRDGCVHCHTESFAFARVFSIGSYDGPLRHACVMAKESDPGISVALAERLMSVAGDELGSAGVDVVIPVPHHWRERLLRRHLPPESMARTLARRLLAPFRSDLLVKTCRTPAQTDLTPTERRANLRNAFACPGVALRGATVLLVDDVLTTGTTAHRCSVELRRTGAGRILVAVAARGIGPQAPGPLGRG